MKKKKTNQYTGTKRPNVIFTEQEHKALAHFCIDKGINRGEFIRLAALHCMAEDIVPGQVTKDMIDYLFGKEEEG